MTVDDFVQAEILSLQLFATYYKEQLAKDPESWPSTNDYSDWLEQHDFSRGQL